MKSRLLWAAGIAIIAALAISRHVLTIFFAIQITAAIIALVLHELSHGLVALYYGDRTAQERGRLTLNPVAHIDPFGTLILPSLLLLLHLSPIGFAKPVPIDPSRMRNPRHATLIVSIAGPLTNLVLSILAGVSLRIYLFSNSYTSSGILLSGNYSPGLLFGYFLIYFGIVNAVLFIFNILPIPPLDGSAILRRYIGDGRFSAFASKLKFLLPLLLVGLFIFPTLLSHLFSPVIRLWVDAFLPTSAII